jgi:hypothetical protein
MTSLHHPIGRQAFIKQYGIGPLANAIFGLVSASIVYSYLAVESFVNAQLYNIWSRRHDGSPESGRFLVLLGDADKFDLLKNVKGVSELGDRIKSLCHVFGFKKPHENDDRLWQDFKSLVEVSRHFLIHPYPDPDYFQVNMERIMTDTKAGRYSNIAASLIGHFYDQANKTKPIWLEHNTLICFEGVRLLVDK